jgi:plasmid maintenance system antidote protein VapI
MPFLFDKIDNILKDKNLSYCSLARLINEYASTIIFMIKGKRPFTDKVIKKLLPILGITKKDLNSWILADKYPKNVIELAIRAKKENEDKSKLILAAKIDEILKEKGMSRTQLAKQIKHSQSGLNTAIIGKENMSKNLVQKLSPAIDKSPDEIQSWIVAGRYSMEFLNKTLKVYEN